MNGYLQAEISRMEKELHAVKTALAMTRQDIPFYRKSAKIDIPLRIVSGLVQGEKSFSIIPKSELAIAVSCLDQYFSDIYIGANAQRYFTMDSNPFILKEDGQSRRINAHGTLPDDYNTLQDGGSVVLSTNITVICSCDFDLEI